jgi:hypothetical protein
MGLRNVVVSTGDGFIDRLLCVAGAIGFSQGPEFIQQYLQRLGGHVDEAQRQLNQYRDVAAQSNLSLDQLITRSNANADPTMGRLGHVIQETAVRLQALQEAQLAITQAPVWKRPLVFLEHFDVKIAHGTWDIFRPAVPVTVEGLVYALTGMLILLGLYHAVVRYPIAAGYRKWSRRPASRFVVASESQRR